MASSKAEPSSTAGRNARRLGCGAPILSLILLMPGSGKGAEAVLDAKAVTDAKAAVDTDAAMDAKALGVTESILNYCARVDSGSVPRLREKVNTMVQGVSAAALAQARKSAQYRAAYASVTDFVAKIDPHNAKRPCTEALADRRAKG